MRLVPFLSLTALALTAACSRGLTENETVFAEALFGETLAAEEVTVAAGLGITPLPRKPKPDPAAEAARPPRKAPEDLCVRKPSPRGYWTWPAAFVLDETIYFSYRWYPYDAFAGLPESAPFPHSVLMAHELVHVWQWRNRERTLYTSLGAARESVESKDPYYWADAGAEEFLNFGYEQQAAIVEDFVCYALFDPKDPMLDELAGVLRPVLPVDDFLKKIGRK